MKISNFEDLQVWQKAHGLTVRIYKLVSQFPKEVRYTLSQQICRSAASIPANIAEGTGRNSLKEYVYFLYNARGSVEETKYHLILAHELGYLSTNTFTELKGGYNQIGRMLNGLIKSLKQKLNT